MHRLADRRGNQALTQRPDALSWRCFAASAKHESTRREVIVLNRFDPHSPSAGEAEVKYLDGDFRVLRPGAFVRCAVTGTPIPLEELKYWSVERQEAYAGPDAVLKRLHPVWTG
jgi:hypothetical protein